MFPNRTGRTAGNGPDRHHPKRQELGKSSMWSCMWWIWKNLAWFSSTSYTVLCGGSKAWPTWSPVNLIKIRVAFSMLCESLRVSIWKLLGSLPQCSHPLGSPLSPFFFIPLVYSLHLIICVPTPPTPRIISYFLLLAWLFYLRHKYELLLRKMQALCREGGERRPSDGQHFTPT